MFGSVRFAVIGEGKDEHGHSRQGPLLAPLGQRALRGALVTVVERLLRERFGLSPVPVAWSPPLVDWRGQPLASTAILVHDQALARLVDSLLRPVQRIPSGQVAAHLVVLSVDLQYKGAFESAVGRIPEELARRVIPIVFDPELEVLLASSKEPLEDACGLPRCSSSVPERRADLKESLKSWLVRHARVEVLSAEFRQRVAAHLDLKPGSYLDDVPSFRGLIAGLERWYELANNENGRP